MNFYSQHNMIYWMVSVEIIQRVQGIVDKQISAFVDFRLVQMRSQIDDIVNHTRSLVIESMRSVYDELNHNR